MAKISFDVEDDRAIAEFQNGNHRGSNGLSIRADLSAFLAGDLGEVVHSSHDLLGTLRFHSASGE
jgi:hypothetical protein